ncbi:MAG: glycosyltransferase family 87 protein [Terracidiphilus sp.]
MTIETHKSPGVKEERDISMILIVIACALAILFTTLFLGLLPFDNQIVARRDYIVYWATGQQLVHHQNPYDPAALNQIERDAGFKGGTSYYMRNTPWTLPLAFPLGYFGSRAAALPWSLMMLALLVVSVRMLSKTLGKPGRPIEWLGYCFPPALFCVILGQTSVILLFGLVLFLRFYKLRPFAAGAALWLCSFKPHLFLPFALIILIWILVSRSYRILAGAVTAMAIDAAITALVDPSAWSQYIHYMRTSTITREFTPYFGDVLRDTVNPRAEWLAFVPAILGCIWAIFYFWPRRRTWDWLDDGGMLLLVSLLVAPFGWIFDQSVALPAVLVGAARTRSKWLLSFLALIYIAIEIQVNRFDLHSATYLWVAPAWLAWFLFVRASARKAAAVSVATSPSLSS